MPTVVTFSLASVPSGIVIIGTCFALVSNSSESSSSLSMMIWKSFNSMEPCQPPDMSTISSLLVDCLATSSILMLALDALLNPNTSSSMS